MATKTTTEQRSTVRFTNRSRVCAYLKNLFTSGGINKVNDYQDYVRKELNKKRISLDHFQEMQEIDNTISWWKDNVVKHYNQDSLKAAKHDHEARKEKKLVSYFVDKIIKGDMSLNDIKSEGYRLMVEDYFSNTPFGIPSTSNSALVMADKVQDTVITVEPEEVKDEEEVVRHYVVRMTDTSKKDEEELKIKGIRVAYEFDAVDEKDARRQAKEFDPAKRIVSINEYVNELPEGFNYCDIATAPRGYRGASNGKSYFSGERVTILVKEQEQKEENKEENFSKASNREELDAVIQEYKWRYIDTLTTRIETYEDIVKGCNVIASAILKYVNLSEYKESQYSSEVKVWNLEELANKILYSTYNANETAKHVTVNKLDDEVFIRGVNFCGLKCCNIDEVMEYIEEDRKNFEPTENVMAVQAYIDFDDELEYQKFIHLGLMKDQSWLSGDNHFGGGAYCYLDTLETFTNETDSKLSHDVYYMKREERKAKGIGYMTAGVVVRVNGENRIAIDPEGFEYARYIGILPEEEVIYNKPANDFWLTDEEKKMIEDAKAGREWSIIDFGARRSTNKNFWNELKKLGTVKVDSCMWSFKGAAA